MQVTRIPVQSNNEKLNTTLFITTTEPPRDQHHNHTTGNGGLSFFAFQCQKCLCPCISGPKKRREQSTAETTAVEESTELGQGEGHLVGQVIQEVTVQDEAENYAQQGPVVTAVLQPLTASENQVRTRALVKIKAGVGRGCCLKVAPIQKCVSSDEYAYSIPCPYATLVP